MISDALLLLARTTILFLAGLVFLRVSKQSAPAQRHWICLAIVGASLVLSLTMFVPSPFIAVDVPVTATVTAIGDALPKAWPWAKFAMAIWICGFACVTLQLLRGYAVLSRIRRSATPLAPEQGTNVFAADVTVPMLTGIFRPVILMPQSAAAWPESHRQAAIRHELAHLERGDLWANFLAAIACAVYWFHPLVWTLARQMRTEQEAACDDAVIQSGIDSNEYAEALIATARAAAGNSLWVTCPMAQAASLKMRLIRLLTPNTARPNRRVANLLFAGALVTLVGAVLVAPEQVYTVGGEVSTPAVLKKVDPQYTAAARKAGIRGQVVLRLVVGANGTARDIVVERGIGSGLDEKAVQAIRQWRFRPSTRNAVPVASRARIMINFRFL